MICFWGLHYFFNVAIDTKEEHRKLRMITDCTYKVYIRNIQSSLLCVLAVDCHCQGATPEI
jgi:hypothetical protein